MLRIILLALAVIAVIFAAVHFLTRPPKDFNQKLKVGETEIYVAVADDLSEQINGLSGLGRLCRDCGMLFVFKEAKLQNFWMKGMQFPLDFVFIQGGKVTEIIENVPPDGPDGLPSQIFSRSPADMVLEVNAGFVRQNKIAIGDSAKY